jgi:hypothetical protein
VNLCDHLPLANSGVGDIPASTWVTAGAAAMVAFFAGLAFSRGVLRQLVTMVSLAAAVGVSWFVFQNRAEVFGDIAPGLGTDRLLWFSAAAGVLTFILCKGLVAALAALGLLKLAGTMAGWKGMMISTVPSAFMLWVAAMVLRVVGNLYGLETASLVAREGSRLQAEAGSLWHDVSRRLDRSLIGSITASVDPLDMRATANLARLLILWPDGTEWAKLAREEKTRSLLNHPRVVKLGHDPAVRRLIEGRDFAGLLQHQQVVETAGLRELRPVLNGLDLEEAMDRIIYRRPR